MDYIRQSKSDKVMEVGDIYVYDSIRYTVTSKIKSYYTDNILYGLKRGKVISTDIPCNNCGVKFSSYKEQQERIDELEEELRRCAAEINEVLSNLPDSKHEHWFKEAVEAKFRVYRVIKKERVG